ncbi:hypothetical protein KJ632_01785 [Patescibacteria group bacterium]|nr:hypothetical protein [Patescibacteria group bacterium]
MSERVFNAKFLDDEGYPDGTPTVLLANAGGWSYSKALCMSDISGIVGQGEVIVYTTDSIDVGGVLEEISNLVKVVVAPGGLVNTGRDQILKAINGVFEKFPDAKVLVATADEGITTAMANSFGDAVKVVSDHNIFNFETAFSEWGKS